MIEFFVGSGIIVVTILLSCLKLYRYGLNEFIHVIFHRFELGKRSANIFLSKITLYIITFFCKMHRYSYLEKFSVLNN